MAPAWRSRSRAVRLRSRTSSLVWVRMIRLASGCACRSRSHASTSSARAASRVSAVLATTPLLCLGAAAIVHALFAQLLAGDRITWLGWLGALLVVGANARDWDGGLSSPARAASMPDLVQPTAEFAIPAEAAL